jgi:hypothetical protein
LSSHDGKRESSFRLGQNEVGRRSFFRGTPSARELRARRATRRRRLGITTRQRFFVGLGFLRMIRFLRLVVWLVRLVPFLELLRWRHRRERVELRIDHLLDVVFILFILRLRLGRQWPNRCRGRRRWGCARRRGWQR